MAKKKVRVLVAGPIGGVFYRPDNVVNLPDTLVKQHADRVDANKEAVSYALSVNGGNVIEHANPSDSAKSDIEARIAQLEGALANAGEGEKAALEAALQEARAAVSALG